MDQMPALVLLGVFALLYQLYGGLKAVALTDIVQVSLLVLGGLVVVLASRSTASAATREWSPASRSSGAQHPEHFQMILTPDNPFYKDLPGPQRAARRHVDHERQLLGLQPVHHPARAGGQGHRRGAEGHRVRGVPEAADAGDRRAAGHRRAWCSRRAWTGPTRPIRR